VWSKETIVTHGWECIRHVNLRPFSRQACSIVWNILHEKSLITFMCCRHRSSKCTRLTEAMPSSDVLFLVKVPCLSYFAHFPKWEHEAVTGLVLCVHGWAWFNSKPLFPRRQECLWPRKDRYPLPVSPVQTRIRIPENHGILTHFCSPKQFLDTRLSWAQTGVSLS